MQLHEIELLQRLAAHFRSLAEDSEQAAKHGGEQYYAGRGRVCDCR